MNFGPMAEKFIADVHLGKLARLLRLLGFDTLYKNNFTSSELTRIGLAEDRVILSRNHSLKTNKCFFIKDENPVRQLEQVDEHFHLRMQFQPFSRCIMCNGLLETVSKESISASLKQNTVEYFNEFWQCKDCKHIYWKGSHYENMLKTIQKITGFSV